MCRKAVVVAILSETDVRNYSKSELGIHFHGPAFLSSGELLVLYHIFGFGFRAGI